MKLTDEKRGQTDQITGEKTGRSEIRHRDWFERHLSRRALGTGMALAGVAGMAGVSIYKWLVPEEPEGSEVTLDSLELQRREGWSVGTDENRLRYGPGEVSLDSRKQSFSGYDPGYLIGVYQPADPSWQPFFVATMLQSLNQPSLNSRIRLFHNTEAQEAYQRAGGLRELLAQTPDAGRTMLVCDLPGPATVAVGARLADTVTLVPAFDNWPHPLGVVPAHETLGSMIYYAREVGEKRLSAGSGRPVLLMLDSRRLNAYQDSPDQFDNRWMARVPSAADLKARGMSRVIYLVADQRQTTEMDDLNTEFVDWQANGIEVRMLRLSDFRAAEARLASSTPGGAYYYGGSSASHWLFFSTYALTAPRQIAPLQGAGPALRPPVNLPAYQPPAYQPVRRPTLFSVSSGSTGASMPGGVGKIRPTGFGRTSVRVSRNGGIIRTGPGRSGSYGRAGGGLSG
ncbi:MAG: hypothetical protein EBZ36_09245 [Acidobacteria bacterium]|nr:hypothetical protein [Acidobacteriota bacterium]